MPFRERVVETNGRRLRWLDAGHGATVVCLAEPGRMRAARAHELLAERGRVAIFEADAAHAIASVAGALGVDALALWASASSAAGAVHTALEAPDRVRALVLETPAMPDDALRDRVSDFTTPTLVLTGTRDDERAIAAARAYKAAMPSAHFILVYDAGAAISEERPEAFVDVVGDFLERRDAFVISRARTMIHP